MRCVVVDDSKEPTLDASYAHWDKIDYALLPFDTGLGAARNAMIDRVKTPYCLYLDDDFVFNQHSTIEFFRAILEAGKADIVTGQVKEGKRVRKYHGLLHRAKKALVYKRANRGTGTVPFNGRELKYEQVDIGLNFFLGRTDVLRKVRWDPELKINTHTDFFYRAKSQCKIVFCPHVYCAHRPERTKEYSKLRHRKYYKKMLAKHGFERMIRQGQWR